MTNLEKIKSMTAEEFFEFFSDALTCNYCTCEDISCDDNCKAHIIEWLNAEIIEMKPCPFCGATPVKYSSFNGFYHPKADCFLSAMDIGDCKSEIANWNRRTDNA